MFHTFRAVLLYRLLLCSDYIIGLVFWLYNNNTIDYSYCVSLIIQFEETIAITYTGLQWHTINIQTIHIVAPVMFKYSLVTLYILSFNYS